MKGMKNAIHLGILGVWAVLGAMLSIKLVFGAFALFTPLAFWLWFAGFAAVTIKSGSPISHLLSGNSGGHSRRV